MTGTSRNKVGTISTVYNERPTTTTTSEKLFETSSASFSKFNSNPLRFSTDDLREIYTIGKKNINKNKKYQLCQKCSRRCCIVFTLVLLIILGIAIAVPILVISSMKTTTITTMSTTSVTTQTTTSVTTTTAASTVTITSNACTSTWTGITSIYHCDTCTQQFTYSLLSFNYVAIANVTRITFAVRRDSGYFGIDDVSIVDTAAPSIELLSNGGFENGTLTSWTHCVQSGSTATGSVQSTASGISYGAYTFVARTGTYYYLAGATVNTEYLSQTFSSIIGHRYLFSFAYVFVGSGSLTSGDFLLSV